MAAPGQLRTMIIRERLDRIRAMNALVSSLPLDSLESFEHLHIPAASEACLLRGLEPLSDLVRRYYEVTTEELYRVCTENLSDIERVARGFVLWVRMHPERVDATF
jgi:hypothetical protein